MGNERTDGNGVADDDFARRLRDAIPEPSPSYWGAIDAVLADIAGDTDRSVVRLMDMPDQPTTSTTRRPLVVMAAAAAGLVLVAAVAIFLLATSDGSTDLATDTVDEIPPTTLNAPGPTDGGTVSPSVSCYLGDETPIGLVVRLEEGEGRAMSAATHFAPGDGAEVTVTLAEGRVLDDTRTLQMLEVTLGDGAVSTVLWQRTEAGLVLAEDVAVRSVDCTQVAAELKAIDDALAGLSADPLDQTQQWSQLTGSDLALAVGTYCFANDDEEAPFERFVRLTINDDATVTAVTSDGSQPVVTGNATGRFSTPIDMVMTVDRSVESQPANTSLEVWRFVPLTGELIQGPLFVTFDPVDCNEIDRIFTEPTGAWPAETPLSGLFGIGLVSDADGVSSIFEDGTIRLVEEPAALAFATAPSGMIVYQSEAAIRVRDTDGGTATLVQAPDDGNVRLLSVLRYPTDDDVRVAYAQRTGVGSEDELEVVRLVRLDDPSDVIDLGATSGVEQTVTSISAADGSLLVQVNTPGFLQSRVFTADGEQVPTGALAGECQIAGGGCAHDLHLVAGGQVIYLRTAPTGTEVVLADADSGTSIAVVPIDTNGVTGLDAAGRRAIINGTDLTVLIDFRPAEPLVVELPVVGFATVLRD